MKTKTMTTLHSRNPIGRPPLRLAFFLLPLALACFALSPTARAVTGQDGGYPNDNTAEGSNALKSLTSGTDNAAIGFDALFSNTSGNFNTASGAFALRSNTTGTNNTANGAFALQANTTGSYNTANGDDALYHNTTGTSNTATGFDALYFNTTGYSNTANGVSALLANTTGANNTANGAYSLNTNTNGYENTANGFQALFTNTTGNDNTATGFDALYYNTTGYNNTANGYYTLLSNTTGFQNTANGYGALWRNTTGYGNAAEGYQALLNNTGSNNIGFGANAGSSLTTGSNNIEIGNNGVAAESNTIRVGTVGTQQATFIAGISGKAVAGGVTVIVDANGHLGTVVSSARFKDAIKPMDKASEAILALKPVTFHYKKELDPESIPQFGLIAEDVAKVNPDLVARAADGKVYTVRYEAVNAMLLNEFLKEHHQVQDLKAIVAEQQKQIKALTSGLEKVSAQLEVSKPAPRTVLNNQ